MRKHLYLLAAVCIVTSHDPLVAQKLIPNRSVTGVSYAGRKTTKVFIPPPKDFLLRSAKKGGATVTLLLDGFPSAAATSVQYAASVIQSFLPADARVTISARWERITTNGVLANSSITGFAGGWTIDALDPLALYPVALAEKISGKMLNDSLDSDIDMVVNSSVNWYLGTDGNTPGQKYDLVTVFIHEACHGLGFFDSMSTNSTLGWWGIGPFPMIYDTFLENLEGRKLTDTLLFSHYSTELRRELTGGNLYIRGPLIMARPGGSRARIYAPSSWDSGSSISHLDETATRQEDALMTPFIDMGEAIHDPGVLTKSIFGDLGWINTRFIHDIPRDTEAHLTAVKLITSVKSDTVFARDKVCTVYSFDSFTTSDTLYMLSPGSDDSFETTLSVPGYNLQLQYYFFTVDNFGRTYRSPSLIDSLKYRIYIGNDTVRPAITHEPLTSFLETIDTIGFRAEITDNLGVDTAYVEYLLNDGPAAFVGLTAGRDNLFSGTLNARVLGLTGGDSIRYRIAARDSAGTANSSFLPASGFYTIHIEALGPVIQSYATDFTGDAQKDFINDGFTVERPLGFIHYGLNSKHPYESPEENSRSINYTSLLRYPVKTTESGLLISFMEVVLVEPGEEGSVYGSEDFYDYVVVEGSADFGRTWFSVADGYDSRLHESWENTYNGSVDGINSTARGTESMLYSHSFLLRPGDRIAAGDTVLLRFRLFSDPFANGWGWVIEDLKINPFIDDVEKVPEGQQITVYPNPGRGLIRIRTEDNLTDSSNPLHYSVFASSGICVRDDILTGSGEYVIDISGYSEGIYVIVLSRDDWIKSFKYSLVR